MTCYIRKPNNVSRDGEERKAAAKGEEEEEAVNNAHRERPSADVLHCSFLRRRSFVPISKTTKAIQDLGPVLVSEMSRERETKMEDDFMHF